MRTRRDVKCKHVRTTMAAVSHLHTLEGSSTSECSESSQQQHADLMSSVAHDPEPHREDGVTDSCAAAVVVFVLQNDLVKEAAEIACGQSSTSRSRHVMCALSRARKCMAWHAQASANMESRRWMATLTSLRGF